MGKNAQVVCSLPTTPPFVDDDAGSRLQKQVWWEHQPQTKDQYPHHTLKKDGWQRPTLPQPTSCSTISAERLNFQVRKGYWV